MPQGASELKLEENLKPHLARQKGKRLRETRKRRKFGGKARSWKPKRKLKYNQQKEFGLNTESLEEAPHRHAESQASFRTRSKMKKGCNENC
jgi:hypothetical protein